MNDLKNQQFARIIEDSKMLSCPKCHRGSNTLFEVASSGEEWQRLTCPDCGIEFTIAEAIDVMLLEGNDWGYIFFGECKRIVRHIKCSPAQTAIVDIRGIFDRVYHVILWSAGMRVLAGGTSWKHIPQGYIMVSVASLSNEIEDQPIDFFLSIFGKAEGAPEIPVWRELLLQARLVAFKQPELTTIFAVAAIDLVIEDITGEEVRPSRPESWLKMLEKMLEKEPRLFEDLISKIELENLRILNDARNKIAHGKPFIDKLPTKLREAEERWRGEYYEGEAAISPLARFSLHTALSMIRACRQVVATTERGV